MSQSDSEVGTCMLAELGLIFVTAYGTPSPNGSNPSETEESSVYFLVWPHSPPQKKLTYVN